ncbi:hypothetical protein GA0116948_11077 [Chitinophaga costaii]|uniref:Uncharacterized protein n=1 Tax=Chitinophaga costaii TaxID=1335309 RepID=A0A1C4EWM5_9BACT|nr:hypothetical protein GA0116948_11077 [Chitinophaga costaii]
MYRGGNVIGCFIDGAIFHVPAGVLIVFFLSHRFELPAYELGKCHWFCWFVERYD